jgi:hypothetical protein
VKINRTFLTLPELSRICLCPIGKLKKEFNRASIRPDEIVTLGRGPTPLFRRDRLPEILSRVQSLLAKTQTR